MRETKSKTRSDSHHGLVLRIISIAIIISIIIIPKFNLKRNIFIRSITPHGVSDSLNIYEVYC